MICSVYNNNQLAAIKTDAMNAIVVAGAGTGKTRTIIGRIEHLIEMGVSPDSILALTFTKKAAAEISGRIRSTFKTKSNYESSITATTFHGWCSIMIRSFMKDAPTIIDREDQTFLMASARGKRSKEFIKKMN